MKLWIDDIRPAPEGYVWLKSVNQVIDYIDALFFDDKYFDLPVELVDLDHDAGDYAIDGGDYIKLLDYWEELWGKGLPFDIRIHSANPVGVQNMRAIIRKNGWKEIY